ncbi:MAG: 50S ribosomal protein L22 [Candidatus Omnitrophica bacterium]|nr:50S ribosomal protein L22 [Candidatus Omnitrophota bacterium]
MTTQTVDHSKETKSVVRYLRISPRKVRLVVNTVRYKPVSQAFLVLSSLKKKAARMVEKGLKSAYSNAKVKGLDQSKLWVSEIKADGGPTFKRFMSRSMGRADQILKRTTHLTIVLKEGEKIFGEPSLPPSEGGKAKQEKPKQEKQAKAKKEKKEKAAEKAG